MTVSVGSVEWFDDRLLSPVEWVMRENPDIEKISQYYDRSNTNCMGTRWSFILCVFVVAVSAALSLAPSVLAANAVLLPYGLDALESTTQSHLDAAMNFHARRHEWRRFEGAGHQQVVSWSLPRVRCEESADLVGAALYRTLRVAPDYCNHLGLAAPIASLYVDRDGVEARQLGLNLAGSTTRGAVRGTASIAIRVQPTLLLYADGRQYREWNIAESIDPSAASVWYPLPAGWGSCLKYVIAEFLVIIVQAMLIIGLLLQRARTPYIVAPVGNSGGSFAKSSGFSIETREKKMAQVALENIGGRLIAAQEEERSRIGRELHDDICQRLALLSMELEQVNRGSNGGQGWLSPKIEEIRRHCAEIASDVQALSHALHSSKLEYLGIVVAISGFCRELSRQYKVTIDFHDENVPDCLPRDISLALFRITQEALHNAQKYSGVRHFNVSLRGTADEIRLEVGDKGAGFDVTGAARNKGLGLVSMQERVHLVHGNFTIESRVNCGTKVIVCVPFVADTKTVEEPAESA